MPGTAFLLMIIPVMKDGRALRSVVPASAQARCGSNASHRILVVEDDDDIRQLSAEVLTGYGYQVDAAEDGAAGWAALNANSYDLLITDNNMPKISGVELVRKLRSSRMALPVILASGVVPKEELNLQLAATLLKPFTLDKLLGTVEQVLRTASIPKEPI